MTADGSNFRLVEQELLTSVVNGVDYGVKAKLLCRTQTLLLAWFPPHSWYRGRMQGTGYAKSTFRVVPRHAHGWRQLDTHRICEGERLNLALFVKYGREIDALFGEEGLHQMLDPKMTLVIGDNEPWSRYGNEMPVTGREFGYERSQKVAEAYRKLKAEGVTGVELHMRAQQLKV